MDEKNAELRDPLPRDHGIAAAGPFKNGEEMPFHEFLSRFERQVCGGVVPAMMQRPVRVELTRRGEIAVFLGVDNGGSKV